MTLRKIETLVTPEMNDIGEAFKSLIKNYKAAVEDGWQPTQDIPAILLGSMTSLMNAVSGLDKVGDEMKNNTVASIMGALIPISEGVELLIKNEAV